MTRLQQSVTPQWLIRDLIFRGQIGLVYAPPGSYKSFVALSLASRLAHGKMWGGRPMKPCRVIYVAGEGFTMMRNRRLAWFTHHKVDVADDGLEVIDGSFDLTKASETQEFIDEIKRDADGIGLMIFDTLSCFTAGLDECDSATMTAAIENAKFIARDIGCAVLFIHHPGKDVGRGARGHSSLKGNIDTEWLIERDGNSMACKLTVTKQKDAERGQEFWFEAHKVALGIVDDDGEELSSLCLAPSLPKQSERLRIDRDSAGRRYAGITSEPLQEVIKWFSGAAQLSAVQARRRVEAAIPEEWTLACDGEVEIRRVKHGNGKATVIETRFPEPNHDLSTEVFE